MNLRPTTLRPKRGTVIGAESWLVPMRLSRPYPVPFCLVRLPRCTLVLPTSKGDPPPATSSSATTGSPASTSSSSPKVGSSTLVGGR